MTRKLASPKYQLQMTTTIQNVLEDGSVASSPLALNASRTLDGEGVQENDANRAWQWKNKSLSSGASLVIDMYDFASIDAGAGIGKDGVGQELLLEEAVAIAIVNENAITADGILEVEPDATNGWTAIGTHTGNAGIRGQGVLFKAQPAEAALPITDGANHRLKLTASGGAVTYSIYLYARHDSDDSSSSSSSSTSSSSSSPSSSSSASSQSSSSSSSSFSSSSSSSSFSTSSSSSSHSSSSSSSQSLSTSSSASSSSFSSLSSSSSSISTSSQSSSSSSVSSSSWSS